MAVPSSGSFENAFNEDTFLSDVGDTVDVLHIEDDAAVADLVSTYLQREGETFAIRTETDPRDGLEAVEEHDVDCVVSDYDMPELTGLDVLERVRESHPHLPFILFTGKGSEEIASEAITAGVTEYLQKEGGTDQYKLLANRIGQAVARRRAEKQVERSFRAIETSHDGISILSEEGDFIYVNGAYAEITGYDRDDLVGEHFETLYPEEDVHLVYDEIIPTAAETGEWSGETTFLTEGGGPVRVDHQISFTAEDAMVCTISETDDVDEVREELSLKEQAMDEAPIGITISDPSREDNPLIYANDEFAALTGYDRGEFVGRNCRFLQGEATREEPVAEIRRAIDAEEPVSVELRNYRKDGEMFWNRVTIAPLYGNDGDLEHYVGFQEDVTTQRELLEEFSDLGSVMAHDMRNPLQTVRGRLELAVETGDVAHVEDAMPSLERADLLVADIADVLSSGTIVGERETIELQRLAEHVWNALDRRSADDTIEIEDSLTVRGDESALRRMFDNLLGNVIEHGEPPVQVQVGATEDGFYVEDDGSGIPVENRDQVFEHGFSTKTNGDGTGMGMASVRQIVLAHEWQIDVADAEALDGVRFEVHTD